MRLLIANYKEPREAINSLMESDCKKRIVTFYGKGGIGKTWLLATGLADIPKTIQYVPLNCKGSAVSVSEVFSRTVFKLGCSCFPTFIKQVGALSGVTLHVENNELKGFENSINIALSANSPAELDEHRRSLTDTWFRDLAALDRPLLISFDTYELATSETAIWVTGSFLYRAANTETLRVLIAGRKVPNHVEYANEWGYCCTTFHLTGVKEPSHWMSVVEALGYKVPSKNPVDFMSGICQAFKGRPADIMKCIEGFPR
jgi:hypothetical protein